VALQVVSGDELWRRYIDIDSAPALTLSPDLELNPRDHVAPAPRESRIGVPKAACGRRRLMRASRSNGLDGMYVPALPACPAGSISEDGLLEVRCSEDMLLKLASLALRDVRQDVPRFDRISPQTVAQVAEEERRLSLQLQRFSRYQCFVACRAKP
jgi:hypothetical protein